jgi:hypothetical protein
LFGGCKVVPTPTTKEKQMAKLTLDETLALLDKAVDERGLDYKYPDAGKKNTEWRDKYGQCLYRNQSTGEPACIVGLALSYVDLTHLLEEGTSVTGLEAKFKEYFDCDAIDALRIAQSNQDLNNRWGDSVAQAHSYAGSPEDF